MPSLKKRKLQLAESTKTNGSTKLKSGKIQKYSSSSESESNDEIPKNKISRKKQVIQKKSTKKHLNTSATSNALESTSGERNLKANEDFEMLKSLLMRLEAKQFAENDSKGLEINHCSDSDERPLVINEDSNDNDLKGLQKYMKDNFKSNNSSPSKSKSDTSTSLQNKSPQKSNNEAKNDKGGSLYKNVQSQKDVIKNRNTNTSESESNDEEKKEIVGTRNFKKDVSREKHLFSKSVDYTSESDSDVPGTQETVKTANHRKDVETKIDVNKKTNVTSSDSESDHEEIKRTVITEDIKKDELSKPPLVIKRCYPFSSNKSFQSKPNIVKNSNADTSESDSDVGKAQKTVDTTHRSQDAKIQIHVSKKLNLVASESESGSEEKKKAANEVNIKTDVKFTLGVNKNSNAVSSESDSDMEASKESSDRKKFFNKDAKNDMDVNKTSTTATLESNFDSNDKRETSVSTENVKKDVKTSKGANTISKASSSDSDEEEKVEITNTSEHVEDVNIEKDVDNQSNLNPDDTAFDGEEVLEKDLKNKCNLPIINYDLQMLSELKEKKCSDGSDFELSLGNSSSHEEKEQESSDNEKPKSSNHAGKNKRVVEKKDLKSLGRIASTVPEVKREPEEVSSDDSADEEDLNEIGVNFNYSKYKPTEEERLQLANMLVVLRHPVLPQHKIETTAGTRTMNENERQEFEQYATLKQGKFSPEEDKQIKKNWKTFCRDNHWNPKNPKPFLFMKHKNKVFFLNQHSRRKFMRGLAHGLPNRSLYSVFQRFRNLFEPHRTCRYESDEDRKIMDYVAACEKKKVEDREKDVNEKDRKFAELALMLSRTRASVWRRYRVLRKKGGLEGKDYFCHSSK